MLNNGLFTSNSSEWETPQELFDKYNQIYDLQFDVACTSLNCKCLDGFKHDLGQNGLTADWKATGCTRFWMNPPYGKDISKWVKKAYDESRKDLFVVSLLPARTDTKWFHDYCYKTPYDPIFLRGRLKFSNNKNSAPFPSMIIIFGEYR